MSIYPRTNYEMTESDLAELLAAMRSQPVTKIGYHWSGGDQQERANAAWARLGLKMGFDPMSVQPGRGGNRFFTAIPSETEQQRNEREARERVGKRTAEIQRLQQEIDERTAAMHKLIEEGGK